MKNENLENNVEKVNKVIVVDVQMKFMSMANFMVKWFFASILAGIVAVPVALIVFEILSAIIGSFLGK